MPTGPDPVPVPPPPNPDSELAARIARGDSLAESQFFRRHLMAVTMVLQQQRLAPDRVDDLIQETFIVVIKRLRKGDIKEPERIRGFLRQTAIHLANGELRRHQRQRTDNDSEGVEIIVDQGMTPPENVDLEQLAQQIFVLMAELPQQRDRELLNRFSLQQQDKAALCSEYGLSSEHFDRVLHRARLRLKELLKEHRG